MSPLSSPLASPLADEAKTCLSVVMYILLLCYAIPGPAAIRLMTARRAHRKAAPAPALKS